MIGKILKKLASLIVILIILSFLVFGLMYLAPGDPAERKLSEQGIAISREVLEAERAKMGLDKPGTGNGFQASSTAISEILTRMICR